MRVGAKMPSVANNSKAVAYHHSFGVLGTDGMSTESEIPACFTNWKTNHRLEPLPVPRKCVSEDFSGYFAQKTFQVPSLDSVGNSKGMPSEAASQILFW